MTQAEALRDDVHAPVFLYRPVGLIGQELLSPDDGTCTHTVFVGRLVVGGQLGDFTGVIAAVTDADTAVRNGEDHQFGSLMQTQISTALAMLATGDAEQAAIRLSQIFSLPADMRLATFNGRLSHAAVLASAAPYRGSQAARTIKEQVRVYLGQQDGGVMPYPLAISSGAGKRHK